MYAFLAITILAYIPLVLSEMSDKYKAKNMVSHVAVISEERDKLQNKVSNQLWKRITLYIMNK